MIKVRATKDGQKLYIKEISGEHNHEVRILVYVTNMVIYYRKYNSCRKYFVRNKGVLILKQKKKEAVKLLTLRANKKLVQNHLTSKKDRDTERYSQHCRESSTGF